MIIEGFNEKISKRESDGTERFRKRVAERQLQKKLNKRRIISGTGPFGSLMVFFIDDVLVKFLGTIYDFFIDTLTDGINWVQQIFFSDFKGFLAGKLKQKRGSCFENTLSRYFITVMLPPLGIFLSRGASAWYNIVLCGLLCFFKYVPGLIYAIIVMHNAPYANRYRDMKRKKLEKSRPPQKNNTDQTIIPLMFFLLGILVTGIAIYISVKNNPNQELSVGNPLNHLQNYYNKYYNSIKLSPKKVD
jgi:uncharacterized membrane protein YqaE (UPF0057 family)